MKLFEYEVRYQTPAGQFGIIYVWVATQAAARESLESYCPGAKVLSLTKWSKR